MPSVLNNRLQADYEKIKQLVGESGGTLALISVVGSPPMQYVIEYHCRSLTRKDADGQIVEGTQHRVELTLGADYPFEKGSVVAKVLTPVFNPHVWPNGFICLGDQWSSTESLDALVLRIGALLQFDPRVLNFNSPANGEAGAWAQENLNKLPLGTATFHAPKVPQKRIEWH